MTNHAGPIEPWPSEAALAAIQSKLLRRIGTWSEQDWSMQGDPPLLVKHFNWAATAKTKHHPSDLALTYWGRATIKPAQMEILHARVEQERFALAKLEAMVWAATQGFAFITPPLLDQMITGAMIALMTTWTEQRAFPLNYAEIIRHTIGETFRAFNNEVAACEAYQAHVDPDDHGWGLRIAIEPLVPATPLIETTY